jgi:hypothetical protein
MLKIVEATFTDAIFLSEDEIGADDRRAKSSGSAGQRLAGLWTDAVRKLPTSETTESEAYEALEALYKASHY